MHIFETDSNQSEMTFIWYLFPPETGPDGAAGLGPLSLERRLRGAWTCLARAQCGGKAASVELFITSWKIGVMSRALILKSICVLDCGQGKAVGL